MMRKILFAGMMALAPIAHAQEYCSDIIRSGVWSVDTASGDRQTGEAFLNWYCSGAQSAHQAMRTLSGSVSLPVAELPVPINIGGEFGTSESTTAHSQTCAQSQGSYQMAEGFSRFSQQASAIVVGAWERCMSARSGFTASVVQFADPLQFRLTLNYRAVSGDTPSVLVSIAAQRSVAGAAPEPFDVRAHCSPSFEGDAVRLSLQQALLCRRNSSTEAITFVFNTRPELPTSSAELRAIPVASARAPATIRILEGIGPAFDEQTRVTRTDQQTVPVVTELSSHCAGTRATTCLVGRMDFPPSPKFTGAAGNYRVQTITVYYECRRPGQIVGPLRTVGDIDGAHQVRIDCSPY